MIPTGGTSCRSASSNRTVATFPFNIRQSKVFEISVRHTEADSLQDSAKFEPLQTLIKKKAR